MCSPTCCSGKSPIARRLQAIRQQRMEEEEALRRPKPVICTPESELYAYGEIEAMAEHIMKVCQMRPRIGLICGHFLRQLVDIIEEPVLIPFEDIPQFPVCSTLEGARNHLVVGTVMGATVMAMQDRFHTYEGYQLASSVLPVRVMKLCGVQHILLTCAAAAVNPQYAVGDIMLIKDHINMLGMFDRTPLTGAHDPRFGVRKLAMTRAYDRHLIEKSLQIGGELGFDDCLQVGVFGCLCGPTCKTNAEGEMLRVMGVDAVGMSLVHEVIVSHHCGLKIFSLGIITLAASKDDEQHEVAEAQETQETQEMEMPMQRLQACTDLISRLIYCIHNNL
ncbi:purine nucleoside phosphorylase 1 [Drosophila pseudoobscura]|uniref:purine-nucleoside phosphorylase n=1 Tax=Drosophila pseudoobscura pseudoobscura TaxID=46245 RepID=A0A6I8UUD3_DROPS|nr:purine nucleoside phosphorylase 1 [Drosophila pseudoobscura]